MTPKRKKKKQDLKYMYIWKELEGVSKVSYFEYFNLKVYTTFNNHGP